MTRGICENCGKLMINTSAHFHACYDCCCMQGKQGLRPGTLSRKDVLAASLTLLPEATKCEKRGQYKIAGHSGIFIRDLPRYVSVDELMNGRVDRTLAVFGNKIVVFRKWVP